jgi:aminodeoxyfutalosine synthase
VPSKDLEHRIDRGERITPEEALALYHDPDLFALGRLADRANRRKNGLKVYFNVNRHINPTNHCVYTSSCTFCSFAAKPGEEHAYVLSDEQILEEARDIERDGVREIHVVGGLHHKFPFDWYKHVLGLLKEHHPSVHLKAYTAVEIEWFTRLTGHSAERVLDELKEAGLDSMPGGGAEIFADRVRRRICPDKADAERWLEIHEVAHGRGIRSNATMLYGHVETLEERVDHMNRLREVQDRTGGFQAFIPLAYLPENNELDVHGYTSALDDLRTVAVSRLFLDNFRHVKTYWVTTTEKVAQLALLFGANDIDGTVRRERISHMAGALSPEHLPEQRLVAMIRESGRVPVERDTLYHELRTYEPAETALGRAS